MPQDNLIYICRKEKCMDVVLLFIHFNEMLEDTHCLYVRLPELN